jgi:hypothetical protein
MNKHLSNRLVAIRSCLMAHHQGGKGLPSDTTGGERQILIDQYLAQVLPPIYRFGSGVILDSSGRSTRALDIVIELPLAPNFPQVGGQRRLYLCESVAAVLEVKSNLSKQWDEAKATITSVKRLERILRQRSGLLLESSPTPGIEAGNRLPCYVVAYEGQKSAKILKRLIEKTGVESRPDGILVLDSGAFSGQTGQAEGAGGLFQFVAELVALTNATLQIAFPSLGDYLESPDSQTVDSNSEAPPP